MVSSEKFLPNEDLRRTRNLKGWTQTELAEQVGTSFEMVSRWERGVTIPSAYFRKRLCSVLDKTAEELGFVRTDTEAFALPPSPFVLLVSAFADTEKAIVTSLKAALHERGIMAWNLRQFSRRGDELSQKACCEVGRGPPAILIIASPEARNFSHIQESP